MAKINLQPVDGFPGLSNIVAGEDFRVKTGADDDGNPVYKDVHEGDVGGVVSNETWLAPDGAIWIEPDSRVDGASVFSGDVYISRSTVSSAEIRNSVIENSGVGKDASVEGSIVSGSKVGSGVIVSESNIENSNVTNDRRFGEPMIVEKSKVTDSEVTHVTARNSTITNSSVKSDELSPLVINDSTVAYSEFRNVSLGGSVVNDSLIDFDKKGLLSGINIDSGYANDRFDINKMGESATPEGYSATLYRDFASGQAVICVKDNETGEMDVMSKEGYLEAFGDQIDKEAFEQSAGFVENSPSYNQEMEAFNRFTETGVSFDQYTSVGLSGYEKIAIENEPIQGSISSDKNTKTDGAAEVVKDNKYQDPKSILEKYENWIDDPNVVRRSITYDERGGSKTTGYDIDGNVRSERNTTNRFENIVTYNAYGAVISETDIYRESNGDIKSIVEHDVGNPTFADIPHVYNEEDKTVKTTFFKKEDGNIFAFQYVGRSNIPATDTYYEKDGSIGLRVEREIIKINGDEFVSKEVVYKNNSEIEKIITYDRQVDSIDGRPEKITITDGSGIIREEVIYLSGGGKVERINDEHGNQISFKKFDIFERLEGSIKREYNENGNEVSSITTKYIDGKVSSIERKEYEHYENGRLKSETTYDGNGRIIEKEEYSNEYWDQWNTKTDKENDVESEPDGNTSNDDNDNGSDWGDDWGDD